jgi:hypothetical protein
MLYMSQAVPPPIIRNSKLTHDSGKKQKKPDKYPILHIQF